MVPHWCSLGVLSLGCLGAMNNIFTISLLNTAASTHQWQLAHLPWLNVVRQNQFLCHSPAYCHGDSRMDVGDHTQIEDAMPGLVLHRRH